MVSDAVRRKKKQQEYLREIGRPTLVTGAEMERALRRVRSFHARGMTFVQMERATGIPQRTVMWFARADRVGIYRVNWDALMRMQFEEPDPHAWVDPTGTRRRIRALWVAGYPLPWMTERLGVTDRQYLQQVIRGSKGTSAFSYAFTCRVADLYAKFELHPPGESGIDPRASRFAITFAKKKGCEPAHVWDPDTIDDPDAFPEWTGACGTEEGARIHVRERIPVCGPCSEFQVSAVQIDRLQLARSFDHEAFKRIRKASGYSQAAVERAAGLCLGQIHHWESGRHIPRDKYLIKALEFLNVGFEDVSKEEV